MIRGNYQKLTCQQRATILQYKQMGKTNTEISKLTGVNPKTISSIKSIKRKSKYESLEEAIKNYIFRKISLNRQIQYLPKNGFKSFIMQEINEQVNWDTSKFQELINQRAKNSKRRRIVEKLTPIIISDYSLRKSNNNIIEMEKNQIIEDTLQSQSSELELDQIQKLSSLSDFENPSNYIIGQEEVFLNEYTYTNDCFDFYE